MKSWVWRAVLVMALWWSLSWISTNSVPQETCYPSAKWVAGQWVYGPMVCYEAGGSR